MKRIALFSSILAFCLTVGAQETTTNQKDTIELLPVEVKALRANATAPFSKTNLRKAEIEKQNLGQDLPFLLNQTPSVVVNSDAGNGVGYTGIRIRGTDATRINVTLNGIPFNDAESSGSFFVNLPDFASSVNSIQIQRGVGTSSNGGGAFGATINMSTNEVNKQAYAEFNNSFGSFTTLKNTLKVGTGLLGNHFTIDGRFSRITSDGYIDRASSNLRSFYVSSAYLSDRTNLRLNVFAGKEKTYQAWYGVSEADLATNRTINYAGMERPGEPYENETDNYNQDHYQLLFDQKLGSHLVFNTGLFLVKGKGFYEQYKAGESFDDYGLTPLNSGTTETDLVRQLWLDNNFYGNIFSLQYGKGQTALTLGGAVTNYLGNHFGTVTWTEQGLKDVPKRWYDNDGEKSDFNLYGKWQQNLSQAWQVFTDLQYRRVHYTTNGFRDHPGLFIDQTYNFFNPKLGLSYSQNNWLAYASYSVANKEPNRDDFEAGAAELPRPEQLHDIELGLEKKLTSYSLGAALYYMKYNDQLVLTGKINDVGAYTRSNIKDSYRAGIELQGGAVITKWLQASANLALSKNKIKGFNEYIDEYDSALDSSWQRVINYKETDISFSPDVVGSATVAIKPITKMEVNLIGKYVGRQFLDNTSNKDRSLAPYYTQDIRATYSFPLRWFSNVSVIAQVNNVFNRLYEPNGYTFTYIVDNNLTTENYYFPMAGTNWTLGLNIKL
ncbi:MAG TPA: TonB-dependent receptor plug domain-containing protein [Chitinophagaceae bacterium]